MSKRALEGDMVVPDAVRSTRAREDSPSGENMVVATVETLVPRRGLIAKILVEDLASLDAKVVKRALAELSVMCNASGSSQSNVQNSRMQACQLGAHVFVFQTMTKWNDNEDIQAICCNCIAWLARDSSEGLIGLGAMEAIVNVMNRFLGSLRLQRESLGALIHVGARHYRRFVKELDGVHLLVAIMKRFPEDLDVQFHSCNIFCQICFQDEDGSLKDEIIKGGAVPAVVRVLEQDFGDNNDKIQEAVSDLVEKLFAQH